jgi:hypothetical protein
MTRQIDKAFTEYLDCFEYNVKRVIIDRQIIWLAIFAYIALL